MDIAVYAICYNEEFMLPFFLNHYHKFTDDIIIYDNHSSDSSVKIMTDVGVDVRHYETNNEIRDDIMVYVKNQIWKESKGLHDWVIIVDIDEFIYHPNLKRLLLKNTNASLFITNGYNMFADKLPDISNGQIYEQAKFGSANPEFYNKQCIFRPNKIKEINFDVGCHHACPEGEVNVSSDRELKLLHYDYLTLDYRINKCINRGKRLSEINKSKRWGVEYTQTIEEITKDYHEKKNKSVKVV